MELTCPGLCLRIAENFNLEHLIQYYELWRALWLSCYKSFIMLIIRKLWNMLISVIHLDVFSFILTPWQFIFIISSVKNTFKNISDCSATDRTNFKWFNMGGYKKSENVKHYEYQNRYKINHQRAKQYECKILRHIGTIKMSKQWQAANTKSIVYDGVVKCDKSPHYVTIGSHMCRADVQEFV